MTELAPGSRLGRYQIEGVVGRGGMGVVYRAIQDGLDRPVALKVITPELAGDQEFRARFQREARLAASLDHPNVIPVYEAGEDGTALYLAMRFVNGEDLSSIIKRGGPLPAAKATDVVEQVAAALDAAHTAGLVHRDIKPHNVLMAGDHAYLTDFGLTKRTDSEAALTRTGVVLGTLDYAAPEQLLGDPVDRRCDVYSLACMTFQLLTAKPPFERSSDTARMLAHMNDPPPDLPSHFPPALSAVVKHGMAKAPDDRLPTAGAFARACAAALTGGGAPTQPGRTVKLGAPAAGGPRRVRVALTVALPLLVAAVVVALVAGSGDEPRGNAGATVTATAAKAAPRAVASIPVGDGPDGIAVDSATVWLVAADDADLERIDPATNTLIGDPIPAGKRPDSIAVDEGGIYITSHIDNKLLRFEADPDPVAAGSTLVGSLPEGVSLGPQHVWVALAGDGTVQRVDRASNALVGDPIVVGAAPVTAYVGQSGVWVPNADDGTVTVIDAETAAVLEAAIPVGREPRDVVQAFGAAWVVLAGDDAVVKIDPETLEVEGAPIPVGDNPRRIAAGEGALWVTNRNDDTVSEIDPDTGRVKGRPIPVGSQPTNIAAGLGAIWVSNPGDDTVTRIDPDPTG